MQSRARGLLVAGLVLAAVLAGCAVLDRLGGGDEPLAFSHALHVGQEELDCVICHDGAFTDDAPGMPYPDTCRLCHDELDAEAPPERRVETLFEGDEYRAARHSELGEEVVFSHLRHVDAGVECASCHAGIDTNARLDARVGVGMPACMGCHEGRDQPNECATCHTEVDRDWVPPSHAHQWDLLHGDASKRCLAKTSGDCALCHTERSCVDCHLSQPPASHTDVFRRRTHGFHASLDRESCSACHRPDSCNACHQETRPMSHTGSWGGTRSRHCFGCHLPLRANGCRVCHEATPSHLLAAPKPEWHTPGMNCRQCHGISAPLPHVDKGDDCNACHM